MEDLDTFVGYDDSVGTDNGDGFGLPVCFSGDAGESLCGGGGGAQGVVPANAVDGRWGGRGRNS